MTNINIPIAGLNAPPQRRFDTGERRSTGSLDGPSYIKYILAAPTRELCQMAAVTDVDHSRSITGTSGALIVLAAGTANVVAGRANREPMPNQVPRLIDESDEQASATDCPIRDYSAIVQCTGRG
jgi:hypothetical protein